MWDSDKRKRRAATRIPESLYIQKLQEIQAKRKDIIHAQTYESGKLTERIWRLVKKFAECEPKLETLMALQMEIKSNFNLLQDIERDSATLHALEKEESTWHKQEVIPQ